MAAFKGKQLYESDINPIFRCLAENYLGQDAPELNVAFFDIETDFEAHALANRSYNPGIKPEVMVELAKRVLRETRGFGKDQQTRELEYLARKHLRMSTAPTEAIVRTVAAARHGAAHVLSMEDVALADRDHQPRFGRDDDGPRAA